MYAEWKDCPVHGMRERALTGIKQFLSMYSEIFYASCTFFDDVFLFVSLNRL
jgi:hypothetical protein